MRAAFGAGLLAFPLLSSAAPSLSEFNHLRIRQEGAPDLQAKQSTYDYKQDTWEVYVHNECKPDEVSRIRNSLAEAGYLAHALHQWKPGGAFQNAMDTYMGKDSKDDPYKQKVVDNISRQWDTHSGNGPKQAKALVYCTTRPYGRAAECRESLTGTTTTDIVSDDLWINRVLLCPRFFDDSKVQTLGAMIATTRANRDSSNSMEALLESTARAWLHETFHFVKTVGDPWIRDFDPESANPKKVYRPGPVADQAKAGGVKTTYRIADAYSMAALAMFQMQNFGNSKVPSPYDFTISEDSMGEFEEQEGDPNGEVGNLESDFQLVKASDADIKTDDYLPMPNKFPDCKEGDYDKKCHHISSCGSEWMPIDDFTNNKGESFSGYRSVVDRFCSDAEGAIVSPGQKYKAVYAVGLDEGGEPKSKGKLGSLNFEINNKFDDYHYVVKDTCKWMLMRLAETDGKCYGPKHTDTKGGTFQIGYEKISYHALGSTKKHDELIVLGAVVDDEAQDADGDDSSSGGGSPFDIKN